MLVAFLVDVWPAASFYRVDRRSTESYQSIPPQLRRAQASGRAATPAYPDSRLTAALIDDGWDLSTGWPHPVAGKQLWRLTAGSWSAPLWFRDSRWGWRARRSSSCLRRTRRSPRSRCGTCSRCRWPAVYDQMLYVEDADLATDLAVDLAGRHVNVVTGRPPDGALPDGITSLGFLAGDPCERLSERGIDPAVTDVVGRACSPAPWLHRLPAPSPVRSSRPSVRSSGRTPTASAPSTSPSTRRRCSSPSRSPSGRTTSARPSSARRCARSRRRARPTGRWPASRSIRSRSLAARATCSPSTAAAARVSSRSRCSTTRPSTRRATCVPRPCRRRPRRRVRTRLRGGTHRPGRGRGAAVDATRAGELARAGPGRARDAYWSSWTRTSPAGTPRSTASASTSTSPTGRSSASTSPRGPRRAVRLPRAVDGPARLRDQRARVRPGARDADRAATVRVAVPSPAKAGWLARQPVDVATSSRWAPQRFRRGGMRRSHPAEPEPRRLLTAGERPRGPPDEAVLARVDHFEAAVADERTERRAAEARVLDRDAVPARAHRARQADDG